MSKIRHIAYRADDPEAMAKFFIEGFGMTIAQRRGPGVIDLTDGTLNLTVLPAVAGSTLVVMGVQNMLGGFLIAIVNGNEAEARRLNRFAPIGHTSGQRGAVNTISSVMP